jgi:hypothetical protein
MVEVFKTNVANQNQAQLLVDAIEASFSNYSANFDLDDCDRILRVVSNGLILQSAVVTLLSAFGFHAEVLPDTVPHSTNKKSDVELEKKLSPLILFY